MSDFDRHRGGASKRENPSAQSRRQRASHVELQWSPISSDDANGAIVGTPVYMAPEQANGLTKQIEVTTDVYALGTVPISLLNGSSCP
jgi:serine/threonine protein kinase